MTGFESNVKITIIDKNGEVIHHQESKNKIFTQFVKMLISILTLSEVNTGQAGLNYVPCMSRTAQILVGSTGTATDISGTGVIGTSINTLTATPSDTTATIREATWTATSIVGETGGIWDLPSITPVQELSLVLTGLDPHKTAKWSYSPGGANTTASAKQYSVARIAANDVPGLVPFTFQVGEVPQGSILTVAWSIRVTST